MRHFDFLSEADRRRLFFRAPQPFNAADELSVLAVALGATLYSPATRPTLAADLARRAADGVLSPMPRPGRRPRWCSFGFARSSRFR